MNLFLVMLSLESEAFRIKVLSGEIFVHSLELKEVCVGDINSLNMFSFIFRERAGRGVER